MKQYKFYKFELEFEDGLEEYCELHDIKFDYHCRGGGSEEKYNTTIVDEGHATYLKLKYPEVMLYEI